MASASNKLDSSCDEVIEVDITSAGLATDISTSTKSSNIAETSPTTILTSNDNDNGTSTNMSKTSNVDVNYSIHFRPLRESDRDEIKKLHEELFPVDYTDHFYDTVVKNLGMDDKPLFSCIAVAQRDDENDDEEHLHQTLFDSNLKHDAWKILAEYMGVDEIQGDGLYDKWTSSCSTVLQGETIVGCVVGTFIDVENAPPDIVSELVLNPTRHTKMFYIMTLGSSEAFRKRGLGSKLIQDCIDVVEGIDNCGVIYLHVITYNDAAIRFYERLGFHRIQQIKEYYTINGEKFDCYLYARFANGKYPYMYNHYYRSSLLHKNVYAQTANTLNLIDYQITGFSIYTPILFLFVNNFRE
jgi:ribosomal protein S18 acetylase RimI-like enzyme